MFRSPHGDASQRVSENIMKQVPEIQVPTREEQLQVLRDTLAGNHAFGRLRGKFRQPMFGFVGDLIKQSDSRTAFKNSWHDTASDVAVIGSLLTKFHRDGWTHAAEELERALKFSEFLIEGESIPLEKTQPITIILLNPEKSIPLLAWVSRHNMDITNLMEDLSLDWDGKYHAIKKPEALREFLLLFPGILDRQTNGISKYKINDHIDNVIGTISAATRKGLDKSIQRWKVEKVGRVGGILRNVCFGFEMEQGEALALFTREEQKHLASWQCRIPACIDLYTYAYEWHMPVHFHSERIHHAVQHLSPIGASAGCSHELGVRVFTRVDGYLPYNNLIANNAHGPEYQFIHKIYLRF